MMNRKSACPAEEFKLAMRRLAGGVALLTTSLEGYPYGITVTAVMSLTLEPPALVVGVNGNSSISRPLTQRGQFCVNLLTDQQARLCSQFVALPPDQRFTVGSWEEHEGIPFLMDAQAAIFCGLGPVRRFGTHDLMIGLVEDVLIAPEVSPLIHADARFGSFR